jgi:hypothetical protein
MLPYMLRLLLAVLLLLTLLLSVGLISALVAFRRTRRIRNRLSTPSSLALAGVLAAQDGVALAAQEQASLTTFYPPEIATIERSDDTARPTMKGRVVLRCAQGDVALDSSAHVVLGSHESAIDGKHPDATFRGGAQRQLLVGDAVFAMGTIQKRATDHEEGYRQESAQYTLMPSGKIPAVLYYRGRSKLPAAATKTAIAGLAAFGMAAYQYAASPSQAVQAVRQTVSVTPQVKEPAHAEAFGRESSHRSVRVATEVRGAKWRTRT